MFALKIVGLYSLCQGEQMQKHSHGALFYFELARIQLGRPRGRRKYNMNIFDRKDVPLFSL